MSTKKRSGAKNNKQSKSIPKKGGVGLNSAYRTEVLVYLATISEPTPYGVSIYTYLPVAKKYQFSVRVSKRMLQTL